MTIEKLINDLEKNPSTLKKAELISKFPDEKLLKEVLFYTLNPKFNFYIKKLPKLHSTNEWDFADGWVILKNTLDDLNNRKITGHEAIGITTSVLEMFIPDALELAKRVLFRDLRCSVSDHIVNKVFPGLIPEFKVQLANKYDPAKKYKNTLWAASRKMDGLRCVFVDGKLFTRNGKEVVGFEHIVKELKTLGKFDLIDGELYSHDIPFQEIQGYVLRNKNVVEADKKKIFYNVFVILMDGTTTESMLNHIKRLDSFNKNKLKYLNFVEYRIIDNNFEKVKALDKEWVAEGYEGVMLRSMNVVYAWKRSDDLLKFKSFKEEDLTVVGVIEGSGKYRGKLGALMCEGKVEGHKVKTEVGSGFNDEQRATIWKEQKETIGKKAEVKYQGLTDDKSSLRFPIFKGFKEDR